MAKRKYVQQSNARQVEIEVERPRSTSSFRGSARRSHSGNDNIVNISSYKSSQRKTVSLIPKSVVQEEYIDLLLDSQKLVIFATGPAGTGKTMLAVLAAIKAFKEGVIQKIIITRPAVGVDDESHGFLPGTLNEKMAPWTRPIFDVMQEYYSPKDIATMLEEETIEISPLAYMRGRSFKNAFIIADEMQNATPGQMKMLLTRIGENCRLVVTGDTRQADKHGDQNGLVDFQTRSCGFSGHKYVFGVEFTGRDIQRHAAVSEILQIYGDL